MQKKSHPFWRFSLRIYAEPGVAQACLALQDECAADVNLLLFCCWRGSLGHLLNQRFLRKANRTLADWQRQVVQPLRQARRNIEKEISSLPLKLGRQLHKQITSTELDAEYLEQLQLARFAADNSSAFRKFAPAVAVASNLRSYCESLRIPPESGLWRHAEVLLSVCRADPSA